MVIGVVGDDSWRANFGVEAAGSQRHVCIDSTFLFGPSPTLSKEMLTAAVTAVTTGKESLTYHSVACSEGVRFNNQRSR
jgi:hypothetical protein